MSRGSFGVFGVGSWGWGFLGAPVLFGVGVRVLFCVLFWVVWGFRGVPRVFRGVVLSHALTALSDFVRLHLYKPGGMGLAQGPVSLYMRGAAETRREREREKTERQTERERKRQRERERERGREGERGRERKREGDRERGEEEKGH